MEKVLYFSLILSAISVCGGRIVKVPEGPLVRVEGQAVVMRCDVSEYEGPRDQDFEWTVQQGDKEVQLISTFDSQYPSSVFIDRVRSGDISVKKLSDSSAQLQIKKVRATDSAVYRCHTPSTDNTVSGNYAAEVELRVIGDTLKVVPKIPQPTVSQGSLLELYCNVTRAFTEHTSISVTWSVKKATTTEDLLTVGPGDKMTPGSYYSQRYADGGLRLDLPGGGIYGLMVTDIRPEDQGEYVCMAREWTRQADGSLHKILEKMEKMGNVTVTPTAQSLMVAVGMNSTTVNVGDTLNLTCSITLDNLVSRGLDVTWQFSDGTTSSAPKVLVRLDRDGVVSKSSEQIGLLRLTDLGFRLLLRRAVSSDSGNYSCLVRVWLPQGAGKWYQAAEKTSSPAQVKVTQLDPEYQVALRSVVTPQFTGDPTELLCQVNSVLHMQASRLGVTWLYTETTAVNQIRSPVTVGSLNERGSLLPGQDYKTRLEAGDIALIRSEPDSFTLRLLHARNTDMGSYVCNVTAWTQNRNGAWDRTKDVSSSPVTVQWTLKTPVLSVAAHRVREASTGGSTFEMSCQVTGQNLQRPGYSVVILTQEAQGAKPRKVLSLTADSVMQLEEWAEPSRVDSVVLEKTGPLEYRFRLYGVQVSDRGLYYCEVTAWTRDQGSEWIRAVSAESNKMEIAFEDTGPVFNVSIHSDKHAVSLGETAKLLCTLTVKGASPNTGDLSFEVRWFQSRMQAMENGGVGPLIGMDRWGVVRKSGSNGSCDCSLERSGPLNFVLTVHGVQYEDVGEYYCTATPWLFSPTTGAWSNSHELTSSPIYLSVQLALWESLKMPVLYGIGASVLMAIVSVLLGIAGARCCHKSIGTSPRSRSKLVDLEMD
ncbi:prostaglandin F2 receptor negative regulator [Denticeps clupeoides]|uniref:prostaglandin F2 receptor negative regulator n=1 Tax=Denticeps clupeoides TaxID=299321 RepID=UPI0010A36E8B|nr:prostaglandin F2 receptor negative regulator [Denticeps clupeoides]